MYQQRLKGVETTATFDEAKDEFVFDSPTPSSATGTCFAAMQSSFAQVLSVSTAAALVRSNVSNARRMYACRTHRRTTLLYSCQPALLETAVQSARIVPGGLGGVGNRFARDEGSVVFFASVLQPLGQKK